MAKNEKVWKVVSHFERLNNPERKCLCADAHYVYEESTIIADVQEEIDGRTVRVTKVIKVDPKERLGKYNPKDFDLTNVVAVGAVNTLKYAQVASDNVDAVLSALPIE